MTTLTLQQAFEACQKNETAWLNRKAELAAAEQEYQEQVLAGDDRIPAIMQELRDIIDVKKWEINQAAGRYIRSHEAVQRISIRNRLNDFMQAHGTEGRHARPGADGTQSAARTPDRPCARPFGALPARSAVSVAEYR